MFCFPISPQKRLRSNPFASFVIHAEFPSNPNQYLPNISEHKIQNEPDSLIDDPSSIFFDPNEKPGFVYTSTASYTNNFDYKQYIPGPENTNTIDEKRLSKVADKSLQENSVSSEYDDSLDTTQSLPNTPSVKSETGIFQKQFSNRNNVLCAENLESDRIYCNSFEEDFTEAIEFHSALKGIDHRNSIPDPSLVDDYSELHLYEDELLYNCDFRNKGYNSESESVKTYQDSGIYDDDVFLESPKPMTSEELESVTEQLFARENGLNENKKRGMDLERFSAFKTPNSSRHNSLELIVTPQSPKMPSFKKPAEMNSGKRSSNKYSHIQAKVQCHRREERSVSPGIPLRKKSPTQAKPPSIKTALCKPTQKPPKLNEIKPKVDSLSNINYVPGGGESKVFTERLTFRQKAEPRTDTHGIEMYAHLPEEFQEIARRLARQDSQLKKQNRGRSASRSHSSSFAVSSRQSSISPERGRSRTRRTSRKLTPGNSISDIFAKVNSNKQLGSPVKPTRPSLSRSSSIRSIPNTPNLYKQHPASAIRSEKSPTASPARSPGRTTESKTLLLNYNEQLNTLKNRNKVSTVAKADRMPSPVMKLYQFTTQNDSFGSLISN
ncbi:uncharacterized protein LOC100205793 [Hydra vulgaris]|uniref:uncharacterized protein LOC100205793 n=1 Tax=Hydra vulgaris TaxID=6087 RepID=UPI001F5F07F0|nr:uncharacterized protein LOC100205793 [Hydra vulgaris]